MGFGKQILRVFLTTSVGKSTGLGEFKVGGGFAMLVSIRLDIFGFDYLDVWYLFEPPIEPIRINMI